jgi:glyoxylase-like metal-dependent hydrolase (beta-lactamase superfamily II)/ferredoxin
MADPNKRSAENVPGEFFVDTTCIDCDQCREIAPASFGDGNGQARVQRQPVSGEDQTAALHALLTCPVGAIGASSGPVFSKDLAEAAGDFPLPIEENVFFCGYASRNSYGASSYFIVRPEGNVLVDSPRFASRLVQRLEALGGVRWMFLSHVDDIADHARFRAHFGCDRIIHAGELPALAGGRRARSGAGGGDGMEIVIEGDEEHRLAPDLTIIPTPGHTRGHQVLLHRDKFLFTGDHLWWSTARHGLSASRSYCWYSWKEQIASMRRLLDYHFEWVLPGHGQRHRAPDAPAMRQSLQACVTQMHRAA